MNVVSIKKLVIRDGQVVGAILLGDRQEVRAVNRMVNNAVDVSAYVEQLDEHEFDLLWLLDAATSVQ